ncbi:translation elongation factor Ts [Falseniella ignava]|uniref:Elongation factor Ts n=2 Tax=Falseniella ignava TaxID=137730 RepID=K1MNN0_9LACT|nr:translation elongation factor Ts [Falseniella ignava]EKB57769.1 translation elongation factor Ts [Falseniella ignava CCUG 37419]PKY90430.1 elongation factor Ts [Falseniella ignava]
MAKITAQLVKELRDLTGVGMMDAKKALVEVEGDIEKAIDHLREKGLAKAAKKADRIAAEGLSAMAIDGNHAAIVEINSETDFVSKNEKFVKLVDDIAQALVKAQPADLDAALAVEIDGKSIADLITDATNTIGEKISFRRFDLLTKEDGDSFGAYSHNNGQISVITLIKGLADEDVARDVSMHVAAMKPRYTSPDEVPADVVEHEKKIQTEIALNEGKPANIVEKMIDGRMHKFLGEISLTEQPFVKDNDVTVGKYVGDKGGTIETFIRYTVGEGMEKRQDNFAEEVAQQMKQ